MLSFRRWHFASPVIKLVLTYSSVFAAAVLWQIHLLLGKGGFGADSFFSVLWYPIDTNNTICTDNITSYLAKTFRRSLIFASRGSIVAPDDEGIALR